MIAELSKDVSKLVESVKDRLVHIGGKGIKGRTGVIWGKGVVVSMARQATDGESVDVVLPSGKNERATVRAYDRLTGLVVLEVPNVEAQWTVGELPRVGELVVTAAYASEAGVEAKLELVRFVSGPTTWGAGVSIEHCFQTDGRAFPGFTGAAVVDVQGRFAGFVVSNRDGNEGFVLPASDFQKSVDTLLKKGSRKKAYLGIQSQGVRLSSEQAAHAQTEAALIVTDVAPDSPAQKAQWNVGDVLLSWNGQALRHPQELFALLQTTEPGVSVAVKVLRGLEVVATTVTPEGR